MVFMILAISHFGFKNETSVLVALVSGHCFLFISQVEKPCLSLRNILPYIVFRYLQVIENDKLRKTLTSFRVSAHNLEI